MGSSPADVFQDVEEEEPARSGGSLGGDVNNTQWATWRRRAYGRKLQAEAGRLATRENICVRSFCWRATSCEADDGALALNIQVRQAGWGVLNDLRVKLGQPRLAIVVEDQYGVYHGGQASGSYSMRGGGSYLIPPLSDLSMI